MTTFNKSQFARLVAKRFGVSQVEGAMFFDEISDEIQRTLDAGNTVFVFGAGTLKVVKSKGAAADTRIRFRPSTAAGGSASTVTLTGLPGVPDGVLTDVVPVASPSAATRALAAGRACTCETSLGRITVYTDAVGMIRCALALAGAAPEFTVLRTKEAAKTWLKTSFCNILPPRPAKG